MYHRFLNRCFAVALVAAMGASLSADDNIDVDLEKIPAGVLDRLPITDKTLIDDTELGPARVARPSYWLGMDVEPVTDVLRSHLPMPKGVGLIIRQVMPDSPAAKAGLQVHDVLIEADGVSLRSRWDLVEAVAKAGEKEMRLSLLRRGDNVTIEATPGVRSNRPPEVDKEPEFDSPGMEDLDGNDRRALGQWLREMRRQGAGNAPPLDFRFFGPAFRMRADASTAIPKNLKIQIQKSGQEPAKIQVQRGDESWDITQEQLDQLPPDIRGHVQRMLGGGVRFEIPHIEDGHIPGLEDRLGPDGFPRIQERLDQMNDRMEQLFDRLDDLRQPREKEDASDEE